ncbi:DUF2178 domain-containing protein [Vagococcus sp. DIV0080]|uniref:DUF2178 domain-containing protein n=1 Tax=Candidatus Vagococcus giribetii TaxID=2230876 RepID=A0ABS3HVB1_9ENTE|nr:DUF2178 domain-containing protein [Vagococcus sp. DIV0080]MBO0477108.1 DUF2178 domain-containing protein [Vagococcus sp. DIV0080]
MKIKSLMDVPSALFYPLKEWTEKSITNFNIFVGIGMAFMIFSMVLYYIYASKIGKSDERTSKIHLKSAYFMLMTIIICDLAFPRDYLVNQFFMIKYSLAIFVSGVYLSLQYRKDFK